MDIIVVTVTKLSLHNYTLSLSPNSHCTIIRCHCHQILTAQLCNLCHCHKILTAQLCNCCHCHKILTAQLQIPLLEKTRLLTNFLTPFGKTHLLTNFLTHFGKTRLLTNFLTPFGKTRLLTNFLTPFGKTYLIFYHHLLSFCLQIL